MKVKVESFPGIVKYAEMLLRSPILYVEHNMFTKTYRIFQRIFFLLNSFVGAWFLFDDLKLIGAMGSLWDSWLTSQAFDLSEEQEFKMNSQSEQFYIKDAFRRIINNVLFGVISSTKRKATECLEDLWG